MSLLAHLPVRLASGSEPGTSRHRRDGSPLGAAGPTGAAPEKQGLEGLEDAALDAVISWAAERGMSLYPTQEEALLELLSGSNVVLSTPTGSGKSLVAAGAQLAALAAGRRSYYTAPVKALVSEKFFELCALFGPERVGMVTGDVTVNAGAPVICCTAEILANLALRQGEAVDVGLVCMDEFHFYADRDRGWAWQVPLLEMRHTQFLLMSATLGDMRRICDDLSLRTGRPTRTVSSTTRPIPLDYTYALTPLHETIEELLHTGRAPVYVVQFTQAAALSQAQALTSVTVASRERRDEIAARLATFRFSAGFGRTLSRLLRHGIGVHHAGMLPRYRRLVEQLAQAGLLTVICGTDTLGVGINVPIRTVLITSLAKFDGRRVRLLRAREFHQIAGRAGRAGFDTAGTVVVQAPEHEIENERLLARAGDDDRKRRRVVRRKPPEGSVTWTRATFDRLVAAPPETLVSRFTVSNAMLLQVAQRPGDALAAMWRLLRDNHEEPAVQRRLLRRALAMYRALLAAGVVERLPVPDAEGRTVRVVVDLQADFALNQALSPFAIAALELLDEASPSHALDVLSVLEATLDDPRQVLYAQQYLARGEAVAAMKAEGIDYEERIALLDDVTWPKPLADLLEVAFLAYAKGHPWVLEHQLSPKSVARDLYERAMSFTEYVGFYGLASSEGLLLRYLADAYRALRRTVPEERRTEHLTEITEWLGELVRQVDSSLLDEWEALVGAGPAGPVPAPEDETTRVPAPLTANRRAFRVLVRNAMFRRVLLVARQQWADLGALDGAAGWDAESWRTALHPFVAEHGAPRTGADARGPGLLLIEEHTDRWVVRQILDDPAGDHDWSIAAEVDLAASDAAGEAVLRLTGVSRLD